MKRSPFHRAAATPLRVVAAANDTVELMLYDEIGYWGITAKAFKETLDSINAGTIHMRINSPGGDVFDGFAMYNALREHPADVVTYIDGVAASMASVIAMAGREIHMAENAFLMIHNPWAFVIGNAEDMRKEADLLDKLAGGMSQSYESRADADPEQVRAWMDAETWFTAAEAKEAGLIDAVVTADEEDDHVARIAASFDLSVYAHAPAALTEPAEAHEPTIRDLERALRDAGLSQIAAKAFVAAGRTAAEPQRDVEEAEGRDVTSEPPPPARKFSLSPLTV